jgi:AcrR family transcriptional regulator
VTAGRRRAVSEEDKTRRREDILAAAKHVFAAKGFHATTIADVAKEVGLAYGSVYWYFDSKEELFHALMAAEEAALRSHLLGALAELGERPGKDEPLRTAVRATFEFFEADRAAVKLLFRDSLALGGSFEKHLTGIYEHFIGDLERYVAAAQERGAIVDAPPRMVAFTVAALVSQLALRRVTTDDGVEAAVVADFVVSLVLDGLRPRPGRTRTRTP